jgi:mRNA-degrading endonuclease HigB of HigAB toxin-antitoxin module
MNIIARKNLEAFWRRHPEAEQLLRAWLVAAKTQNWTSMNAVLETFSKASPITAERCVFDTFAKVAKVLKVRIEDLLDDPTPGETV